MCDEVWLVRCDAAPQRDRLEARGYSPTDAAARIETQADLEARLRPRATRVVDTSGQPDATRAVVDALVALALEA
jgi:dephospho-CoA kinase